MTTHVLTIEQTNGVALDKQYVVALEAIILDDPPNMTIYRINPNIAKYEGETFVFSPRILNSKVIYDKGTGGYLLHLEEPEAPFLLSSYTSIAKCWLAPLK